ncbi:helix-turn-helix domain-containing protein [Mycoplasmopsis agassizii]|nr:helix-turn-helix domain-containing protein [Mycoplasmopsis agassizii]
MAHKQLSDNGRFLIDKFLKEGKTITEIAILTNRDKSSISREIKTNSTEDGYDYLKAIELTKVRRASHKLNYMKKYDEFIRLFPKNYQKHYHGVKPTIKLMKSEYPNLVIPHWRVVYLLIDNGTWVLTPEGKLITPLQKNV